MMSFTWSGSTASLGLLSALLAGSCTGAEDSGSGGDGGSGGTTINEKPGCTRSPDCNSCTTCEESCHCKTGFVEQCFQVCASGQGGTTGTGATGGGGAGGVAGTGGVPMTVHDCFKDIYGMGALAVPQYDQFMPKVGTHCSGTNHQDITGVEKVAFFGDSITAMNYAVFPPLTATAGLIYRLQLGEKLRQKFPGVEIQDCSKDGAKTDDFMAQMPQCFPGTETRRSLSIITNGGNNLRVMAEQKMGPEQYQPLIDQMVTEHRAALEWLTDPARFPNGSFVIFANVYEYTDTSADMGSCPAANLIGLSGSWQTGVGAIVQIAERYMQMAVETQTDMLFLLEHFCGHGYKRDDPNLQCYRGAGAELYFDPTCIHPSDAGATALANHFFNIVNE